MKDGWKKGTLVQRKGAQRQDAVGEIRHYEGECFYLVLWQGRELVVHEDDLQVFVP